MTTTNEHTERAGLKPCPFCGAGSTEIVENGKMWTGMKYSDPTSVSVRHWCDKVEGQPSRMLERVGRDWESAVAAWNQRAAMLEAQPDDGCVLRPEDEIQVLTAERDFWKQVASSQRRDAKSEQGWPFTGCSEGKA